MVDEELSIPIVIDVQYAKAARVAEESARTFASTFEREFEKHVGRPLKRLEKMVITPVFKMPTAPPIAEEIKIPRKITVREYAPYVTEYFPTPMLPRPEVTERILGLREEMWGMPREREREIFRRMLDIPRRILGRGISAVEARAGVETGAGAGVGARIGALGTTGIMALGAAIGAVAGAIIGRVIESAFNKISEAFRDIQNFFAPLIAMAKLMIALIGIALRPVLEFFLMLFKPIAILLLRWFIIPFYTKVMPVLLTWSKYIAAGATLTLGAVQSAWESLFKGAMEKLKPVFDLLQNLWTFISTIFTAIVNVFYAFGKFVYNFWSNVLDFVLSAWMGMFKGIYNVLMFVGRVISSLVELMFGPLIRAMAILATRGIAGLGDAMSELMSWVTGAGDRWNKFTAEVGGAWSKLQSDIGDITTNISAKFSKIWSDMERDISELGSVIKNETMNIANAFTAMFDKIGTGVRNMVNTTTSQLSRFLAGEGMAYTVARRGETWVEYKEYPGVQWALGASPMQAMMLGWTPAQYGGIFTKPTPVIVGERGAEAVIPLDRMRTGTTFNITGPIFRIDKIERVEDLDELFEKFERWAYSRSKRAITF